MLEQTHITTSAEFVAWFRSSTPYIHAFRNKTFVINVGGEMLIDAQFSSLVHDIALLNSLGVQLVLVHGARPQIETRLKHHNIKSQFHNEIRITNKASLECVLDAISSSRVEIEALLSMGLANSPMHGAAIRVVSGNIITAQPIGIKDGIDFEHTGIVRSIDKDMIQYNLEKNSIILISPLGYSATGEVFNLRSEDVALAVARQIQAEKLIYLVDANGVLDHNKNLLREITLFQTSEILKQKHNNPANIIHCLQCANTACKNGVKRSHIINRHIDGALLLELFSRDGIGSLITTDLFEGTREANLTDIGGILEIITPLEQQGVLVKRSREQLELEIKQFTVTERDGMIVACAAMHCYPQDKAIELACLAVHPSYSNQSRGEFLLNFIERKAKQQKIISLFVLTTQSAHWFLEHGFIAAEFDDLPMKKRSLYNYQRNSKIFIKQLI